MSRHRLRPLPRTWLGLVLLAAFSAASAANQAEPGNALEAVDYSVLPGERVELHFDFSEPIAEPRSFTIRDPARIALDFPDTRNATGQRRINLDVGSAQSLHIAEASDRTRVVLNLSESTRHTTEIDGSTLVMTLGARDSGSRAQARRGSSEPFAGERSDSASAERRGVTNVDFRRGEDGQGRIRIELDDPDTPVDIQRRGNDTVVALPDTRIPEELRERLDVLDFATPVQYIDVRQRGSDGEIRITPRISDYEQLAYQSDNAVTVEIREPVEDGSRGQQEPSYSGEKLSLNFQQIEVRAVLQLLADFTGLNIVVSDSVGGSITLRLKNVPWDQALDIVLRTQGLDKRRSGNVMFIAPRQELAAREQAQLEAQQQQAKLAPLRTEYIQINYAKASEMASVLQSEDVNLLSERSSVTVDERTNTLLVRATAENLEQARALISRLDVAVRQVLIESRIVIATNDFDQEIGVRFGGVEGQTQDIAEPGDSEFNVNLPSSAINGSFGLAVGSLANDTLIGLELMAMQAEGRGEVVSSPRVITANQNEATISQGVQIPYQEVSEGGGTGVSFQEALLELSVTPQITPDDRILMDLAVTNDQVGSQEVQGVPTVDTREVTTRVMVDNGETVVLGGIYEETRSKTVNRVPFFGNLPVVGHLFRNRSENRSKSELLVFVTPKIVRSASDAP